MAGCCAAGIDGVQMSNRPARCRRYMAGTVTKKTRLNYIDWMRGLACLLMFQTHAYDAWLTPDDRHGYLFHYSQLLGTLPAPLFLFLAGISLALGVEKMEARGATAWQATSALGRRGLGILGMGLLFRVQEWAIAYPWAPWTDLFRVDILNTIGVSLAAVALVPLIARKRWQRVAVSMVLAAAIAMLTPPLWTTHKPTFLPWWLASYINGGHTTYEPTGRLFPMFPWTAFAFAGCAAGMLLTRAMKTGRERAAILGLGAAGVGFWFLSAWLDALPVQLYAVYDYWRTSPQFFLRRVGLLLMVLAVTYGWCALKRGRWWSPFEQLGMTSLLVYWVHIEFVYGRFSIAAKRASSIRQASIGLAIIVVAMLILSVARIEWKKRTLARKAQRAQSGTKSAL
jgi:uncharacterized membrane protein